MSRFILFITILIGITSCRPLYYSETVVYSTDEQHPKKVVRLDLSGLNLKELPPDFDKYSQLKYINLSNNSNLDFDKMKDQLVGLSNLQVLQLDSNNLTELPDWMSQLAALKNLSLSDNPNLNFNKAFKQLKSLLQLEKLNLSNNNLVEFPESIIELQQLKNLRLSFNKFNTETSLNNISKLNRLKFLWLDNNRISILPASIGELSQISELYLGENQIKVLPQQIKDCKKLRILYLGNNEFKILPDEILDMKIYLLAIYGNQIYNISESYKRCKAPMKILILDNNYLNKEQQLLAKKYFSGAFVLSLKNQQY